MKVFISHKREDAFVANQIAKELGSMGVKFYLDVLDISIIGSGKELTDHIKQSLNDCTDIIVIMSEITRYSQWVPFEVGMSAQIDMPTATFLQENVTLPEFLQYWPRLKHPSEIREYVRIRNSVSSKYQKMRLDGFALDKRSETNTFYEMLKGQLAEKNLPR